MGVLTQDMRDILASAMLAFVATVRRDGSPSLSPKSSTIPYDDDHLLFVDIASPQTIANLRNDPRIEMPLRARPADQGRRGKVEGTAVPADVRDGHRRTRVVGAFPDGQSALNLAAARLRHIAGTAWSTKRYLNIELLKDQQMRGAITA
jgi:predicted pyridoxine 5'-phosphate oxidase superfamily flavin-nucleotide-binding protein